ncbi:hypothetical protein DAERI_130073 [Deinococcus aerius]|uniref:Uncharacterized protein n=1 Tax=Deinococcus aerius TaxID=200253 RepID=A0A2I9CYK6_9DEIO|nr:hypothetical protein [Deinococcus aerius]GBF07243.1 hypothetical protein DAERI_130073 [Deinococcus aerius]
MTAASASEQPDFQKLYQQVTALMDFARPLADRLMAAGSLEGALQEGQQMAVEGLMQHGRAFMAQVGVEVGFAGMGSPPDVRDASNGAAVNAAQAGQGTSSLNLGGLAGLANAAPGVMYARIGVEGMRVAADFARDYVEVVQRETTKRHDITAQRDIRVRELELVRETLEQYLKATFDERRSNFQELFKRLDVAQGQGDVQGMQMVLAGILDLAKSSPFKDLATFKRNLDNPDFVLEL